MSELKPCCVVLGKKCLESPIFKDGLVQFKPTERLVVEGYAIYSETIPNDTIKYWMNEKEWKANKDDEPDYSYTGVATPPIFPFARVDELSCLLIGGVNELENVEGQEDIKKGFMYYLSSNAEDYTQEVLQRIVEVTPKIQGITRPKIVVKSYGFNRSYYPKESFFYQLDDGTICTIDKAKINGKNPFINNAYLRDGDLVAFRVTKVPIYVDMKRKFAFCEAAIVAGVPFNERGWQDPIKGYYPEHYEESTIANFLSGPFIEQLINLQEKMRKMKYLEPDKIPEAAIQENDREAGEMSRENTIPTSAEVAKYLSKLFGKSAEMDDTIRTLLEQMKAREEGGVRGDE